MPKDKSEQAAREITFTILAKWSEAVRKLPAHYGPEEIANYLTKEAIRVKLGKDR